MLHFNTPIGVFFVKNICFELGLFFKFQCVNESYFRI